MRSIKPLLGIAVGAACLIAARPATAVPVGTATYVMQSNGFESCLLATYPDVTNDVFGTPINLSGVGQLFCHLQVVAGDQTSHCVSTLDPGIFTSDAVSPGNG